MSDSKSYKMSGAFLVNPDGTQELEVILHLNPKHKKYNMLLDTLKTLQKSEEGLITYSSGV